MCALVLSSKTLCGPEKEYGSQVGCAQFLGTTLPTKVSKEVLAWDRMVEVMLSKTTAHGSGKNMNDLGRLGNFFFLKKCIYAIKGNP